MKFSGRLAPRANGAEHAPRIFAEVILPGRKREGEGEREVDFFIDTGCDQTVIGARDALLLKIDYEALDIEVPLIGATGSGKGRLIKAMIRFSAIDKSTIRVPTNLVITQPSQMNEQFGSLLGRNILRDFTFTMDHPRKRVELEIPQDSPVWERVIREDASKELTLMLPIHQPQPQPVQRGRGRPRY